MDESASALCWYPLYDPSSTNSELLNSAEKVYSQSLMSDQSNTRAIGFPYTSTAVMVENTTINRQPAASMSNNQAFQCTTSGQTRTLHRKLSDYGTTAGGKWAIN